MQIDLNFLASQIYVKYCTDAEFAGKVNTANDQVYAMIEFSQLVQNGMLADQQEFDKLRSCLSSLINSTNTVIPVTIITMRQARIQLSRLGLYDAINSAVAAMPGEAGIEARLAWEYAITVNRDDPFVQNMIAMLGWTEEQTNQFFYSSK